MKLLRILICLSVIARLLCCGFSQTRVIATTSYTGVSPHYVITSMGYMTIAKDTTLASPDSNSIVSTKLLNGYITATKSLFHTSTFDDSVFNKKFNTNDTNNHWMPIGTVIPSSQIQADWAQVTTSSLDYVKNKPTIPSQFAPTGGTNVTLSGTYPSVTFNVNGYIPESSDTAKWNSAYKNIVKVYNKSGLVSIYPMKIWDDTVIVTSASGQSIDISSAGFTKVTSVQAQAANNTSTVSSIPVISVKTWTNSSVSLNTIEENTGLTILAGLVFAGSLVGVSVHLLIIGY